VKPLSLIRACWPALFAVAVPAAAGGGLFMALVMERGAAWLWLCAPLILFPI
jgi:hypothetical protein